MRHMQDNNVHDILGSSHPLDRRGRELHDLRISVMDRCNFRCPYCMPKEHFHEHYRFLNSHERLSFDEIVRLARVFAKLGVPESDLVAVAYVDLLNADEDELKVA